MWRHRSLEHFSSQARVHHQSRFIDKEFQIKYTLQIVFTVMLATLFLMAPFYFFFLQNYSIFQDLAYQNSPELLDHLEREHTWIQIAFFAGLLAMITFTTTICYRMTGVIIGPIKVLRNHLKQLNRGDWDIGKVSIRSNDEFHDFIEEFNYFYLSYRQHINQELQMLKKMNLHRSNAESYSIWRQLIQEKEKQLNIENQKPLNVLNGEVDAEDLDSLHVS